MPKYLLQAKYELGAGIKGLVKEGGTSRREAVKKLIESANGKIEAFYYAFGDTDLFIIADMPNNVSTAAISLTVNAAGAATCKVTPLLTAEEIDAAVKIDTSYRAPVANG
jgi:uncharacterized protein with GYD domain